MSPLLVEIVTTAIVLASLLDVGKRAIATSPAPTPQPAVQAAV